MGRRKKLKKSKKKRILKVVGKKKKMESIRRSSLSASSILNMQFTSVKKFMGRILERDISSGSGGWADAAGRARARQPALPRDAAHPPSFCKFKELVCVCVLNATFIFYFIIRIKKQIININNLNSTFVNKLMQFIQFETFIYTSIYTNNDVIS